MTKADKVVFWQNLLLYFFSKYHIILDTGFFGYPCTVRISKQSFFKFSHVTHHKKHRESLNSCMKQNWKNIENWLNKKKKSVKNRKMLEILRILRFFSSCSVNFHYYWILISDMNSVIPSASSRKTNAQFQILRESKTRRLEDPRS